MSRRSSPSRPVTSTELERYMIGLMRSWLRARETREMVYALAIGFLLNGMGLVARAHAGPLSALEAVTQSYGFAGALGGLTGALIHFSGVAFAQEHTPRRVLWKATFEGFCAVIIGSIVASYFTPYAGDWAPRANPADLLWISYAIGVFAWRSMPLLIEQLPRFIKGVVDAILSAIPRPGGQA